MRRSYRENPGIALGKVINYVRIAILNTSIYQETFHLSIRLLSVIEGNSDRRL